MGVIDAKDDQQKAFNFAISPLVLSTGIDSFKVEPAGTSSVCMYISPLNVPFAVYCAKMITVSSLELTLVKETVERNLSVGISVRALPDMSLIVMEFMVYSSSLG